MRVLFCSYQAISMPGGGIRTQVLSTKKYLEALGVEVLLFDPWRRYEWSEIDIIHVFSTDMRNYYLVRALPDEVALVVSPIIDNTYPFCLIRAFCAFSRLLPRQGLTSYTSHQLAFRKADAVISPASFERRMLEGGLGLEPDRIFDIPNGVAPKFLNATPDAFLRKHGLRDFVLYVGQIGNRRKNLRRLLRVAGELRDVDFVFVGPILQTQEARRILRMAAHYKNVRMLGALPEDELVSAYAACDVLVLPSLIEGTGLVALEAGLAGAKVVVTKYGGPPDYFEDLVEYVEPRSEKSIRQAIETALAKPKDGRLRKHIASNYLWGRVAERLKAVYEQILSRRR